MALSILHVGHDLCAMDTQAPRGPASEHKVSGQRGSAVCLLVGPVAKLAEGARASGCVTGARPNFTAGADSYYQRSAHGRH